MSITSNLEKWQLTRMTPHWCGQCGEYLPIGAPLFFGEVSIRASVPASHVPLCDACADSAWGLTGETHREIAVRFRGAAPSKPCKGCGKQMEGFANDYCCTECRWKAGNAQKKVKRDPVNCQHCNQAFTPARSDAKYCSSKCRVAAHRAN